MTIRLLQHQNRRTNLRATTACALYCYSLLSSQLITSAAAAFADSNSNIKSNNIIHNHSCFNSSKKSFSSTTSRSASQKLHPSPLKMSSSASALPSASSSQFTVAQVPCLDDNYGYLIHDAKTGHTAAVDTPDAKAYQVELDKRGWTLSHIFNTHHHWDHTGGNLELKKSHQNLQIYGPATEQIPGRDIALSGGDTFTSFGSSSATVIDVGGHTLGHIAIYFPDEKAVFVGDALFSLGCGKMFEGTPEQFWSSLQRLRELPDDTVVYSAHEYTTGNAKFAMSVEPNNAQLVSRVKDIMDKRSRNEPTVPSLMGEEKQTNPFLRVDFSEEIRKNVGVVDGKDSDNVAFGKVRRAKDTFRG